MGDLAARGYLFNLRLKRDALAWSRGRITIRSRSTCDGRDATNPITSAMGNLWADRPITVAGIDVGAGVATLHVLTPYGAAQDIELRTNDANMVDRFSVELRPPVIKKWADIDATLSKSGARYSYQVSKVTDGKCEKVAGTNTDLSLPLASIFKLYVLLAVADAVKAGTVSWNEYAAVVPTMASPSNAAMLRSNSKTRRSCSLNSAGASLSLNAWTVTWQ